MFRAGPSSGRSAGAGTGVGSRDRLADDCSGGWVAGSSEFNVAMVRGLLVLSQSTIAVICQFLL